MQDLHDPFPGLRVRAGDWRGELIASPIELDAEYIRSTIRM